MHEPGLLSLNKKAGKKSKENLQQAATKVSKYCLFVVMVNWTKHSEPKLPKWKKNESSEEQRAKMSNSGQKPVKFPSLEISLEALNDISKEGEKRLSEISFILSSMIP